MDNFKKFSILVVVFLTIISCKKNNVETIKKQADSSSFIEKTVKGFAYFEPTSQSMAMSSARNMMTDQMTYSVFNIDNKQIQLIRNEDIYNFIDSIETNEKLPNGMFLKELTLSTKIPLNTFTNCKDIFSEGVGKTPTIAYNHAINKALQKFVNLDNKVTKGEFIVDGIVSYNYNSEQFSIVLKSSFFSD